MATIAPRSAEGAHAGSVARRISRSLWPALALAGAPFLGSGCATPGPNHLYTFNSDEPSTIRDTGPDGSANVPSFSTTEDGVTGMAYDPYTDHLFLRLAPGDRIRVVDRPDRSIKREFTIPNLSDTGGGDLAVRPRDGHIFLICPGQKYLVEADRFGKWRRQFTLEKLKSEPVGLAYDAVRQRLLVATSGPDAELSVHDLAGRQLHSSALKLSNIASLAYDATHREIYAIIPDELVTRVLNEEGELLRVVSSPDRVDFIDLGQRSFVRVF